MYVYVGAVEIADNTENAQQNVQSALEQVRQADERAKYCACSRWKLMCYGGFALIVVMILVGLIAGLS